jgi:putative phage-type endonuclease
MSREQWLQVRKQGIGSSDAAAACGLNPHMSMLELWMIKTGRMQNQPDQPTQNSYSPLYWGNQLEPLIANYYQHKTGHKVRKVNAVLQHPDPDKHFMLANLDYAVVAVMKCRYWNVNLWGNGEPNSGVMVCLYT